RRDHRWAARFSPTPNRSASPTTPAGPRTGSAGGRTSASASGPPSARTTPLTATAGPTSRSSRPPAGPTAGARTACSASATASAGPDDLLIRITATNRGPEPARLHVLPTLWFRNTWSWGAAYDEGRWPKPHAAPAGPGAVTAEHTTLGRFRLAADVGPDGRVP